MAVLAKFSDCTITKCDYYKPTSSCCHYLYNEIQQTIQHAANREEHLKARKEFTVQNDMRGQVPGTWNSIKQF